MIYFETIKCDDFEIYNIKYHEKRISNSIGKNINLHDYIYPPSNKKLKCKMIYDENEIYEVSFLPYQKRDIKYFKLIYDNKIEYTYKYQNRIAIDTLFLQKENADEIIIIKNDFITDTSIANIAIYLNDEWYTPKKPLLYGTTRQRYIDSGEIKEIDITVKMLKNAKKIALLNAMIDFDIIDEYKLLV